MNLIKTVQLYELYVQTIYTKTANDIEDDETLTFQYFLKQLNFSQRKIAKHIFQIRLCFDKGFVVLDDNCSLIGNAFSTTEKFADYILERDNKKVSIFQSLFTSLIPLLGVIIGAIITALL